MELKLFGKKIFEFSNNKSQALIYNATTSLKKSKFLPDFYTFWASSNLWDFPVAYTSAPSVEQKKEEKKRDKEFTPKEIHQLRMLHSVFTIKTDENYIDAQIQEFKDKLDLIQANEYDVSRGTNEIASILVRLENRKKYAEHKLFFEDFAYTTTEKIEDLVKEHDYLQLGKVDTFLADMPMEATKAMKDYTAATVKISKKNPLFYIIAKKSDFEKKKKRRDPILLAQSPFGHFWQILGAWDEEMLLLDEL